jgi:hypothetical protein
MLCPYGMLARQDASGSRKREQAPALQRSVATLNLEIGGREIQKSWAGCGRIAERGQKSKELGGMRADCRTRSKVKRAGGDAGATKGGSATGVYVEA